jgi:hypothetical protein
MKPANTMAAAVTWFCRGVGTAASKGGRPARGRRLTGPPPARRGSRGGRAGRRQAKLGQRAGRALHQQPWRGSTAGGRATRKKWGLAGGARREWCGAARQRAFKCWEGPAALRRSGRRGPWPRLGRSYHRRGGGGQRGSGAAGPCLQAPPRVLAGGAGAGPPLEWGCLPDEKLRAQGGAAERRRSGSRGGEETGEAGSRLGAHRTYRPGVSQERGAAGAAAAGAAGGRRPGPGRGHTQGQERGPGIVKSDGCSVY